MLHRFHNKRLTTVLFAVTALAPATLHAEALQSHVLVASGTNTADGFRGTVQIMAPSSAPDVVLNMPFAASEHRSLVEGQGATSTTVEGPVRKIFRDRLGRTRLERSAIEAPGAGPSPEIIEITDPYAGAYYVLVPKTKTAYQIRIPVRGLPASPNEVDGKEVEPVDDADAPLEPLGGPFGVKGRLITPGQRPGRSSAVNAAPSPGMTDLGLDLINGIEAHGERLSMPVPSPAGPSEGDKPPPLRTTDTWYSPQYDVVVFRMITEPDGSSVTEQLADFKPGEQDLSLFDLPKGYMVIEQPGMFSVPFRE